MANEKREKLSQAKCRMQFFLLEILASAHALHPLNRYLKIPLILFD